MSKNGKRLFRNYDPYVTSPFGYRIHPIYKDKRFHAGVDYGTNSKKLNCYGLEDGKVVGTGYDSSCGNYVYVSYPRLNHNAIYQHLDSIKVKTGQSVNKDTIIGVTGETGAATGIHLHFGWFPSANQNKSYSDKGWEDFEKYNYPENNVPTPTPSTNTTTQKFKIGDSVIINGYLYVSSNAEKPANKVTNKTTKITRYAAGAKHPYNTTGDLGWMDENAIKLATSNNNTNTTKSIQVGSKVQYTGYLYVDSQGNGRGKKVSGTYTVSKIVNAPYGVHLKDWGWVKKSDCKLI